MTLSARAKAVRGVGYSPLLRAVHGLLALAIQPPQSFNSSTGADDDYASPNQARQNRIKQQNNVLILTMLRLAAEGAYS